MLESNKNIVLITIECLRADHMHYMGYNKPITPTLDTLSRLGKTFSNAMATGTWTPASFKSIFSSRYPLMDGGVFSIKKGMPSLPRILKNEGYKTGAFAFPGWFPALLDENDFDQFSPLDRIKRGSERLVKFMELFKKMKNPSSSKKKKKAGEKQAIGRSFTLSDLVSYLENLKQIFPPFAKYYTQQASSWIEKNQENESFLWVHYPDPHETYYPSSPVFSPSHFLKIKRANDKSKRKSQSRQDEKVGLSKEELSLLIHLYDEKIRLVDQAINGLIKKLVDQDLLENTYLIITGDHGQEFLEHGSFGHGLHLYNESIHVPLILIGSDLKREWIDTPVSLINIAPTILDFMGKRNPEFLGASLLDENQRRKRANYGIISEDGRKIKKDFSVEGGEVKCMIKERKVALRTLEWKYIFKEKRGDELYNLQTDPKEKENLHREEPQVASELKKRIQKHIKYEKQQSRSWKFGNRIKKIKKKIETP